jgi:hypothetical protein
MCEKVMMEVDWEQYGDKTTDAAGKSGSGLLNWAF